MDAKPIVNADTPGYSKFLEALNILYDNSIYIQKCRTDKGFPVLDPQFLKSANALQKLMDEGKIDLIIEWFHFFDKLDDIQHNPPINEPLILETPDYNGKHQTFHVAVTGQPSFEKLSQSLKKQSDNSSALVNNSGDVASPKLNITINNKFSLINFDFSNSKFHSIAEIMSWVKSSGIFKHGD